MKNNKAILPLILMIIGIFVVLYPNISNYFAEKNQTEVIREYKKEFTNMSEEETNLELEKARTYNYELSHNLANSEDYEELLNISNNGIMGYIEIPKISVYLPIYHGTEDKQLKKGVGHIECTSLPIGGTSTHCILVGHTGLSSVELFTRLSELEIEDFFYINVLDEKLVYQVYQIEVVLPTEVENLQIIDDQDIVTLVTCTPYGVNTHRLLVHGERGILNEEDNTIIEEEQFKRRNIWKNLFIIIFLIIIFSILFLLHFIRLHSKIDTDLKG